MCRSDLKNKKSQLVCACINVFFLVRFCCTSFFLVFILFLVLFLRELGVGGGGRLPGAHVNRPPAPDVPDDEGEGPRPNKEEDHVEQDHGVEDGVLTHCPLVRMEDPFSLLAPLVTVIN